MSKTQETETGLSLADEVWLLTEPLFAPKEKGTREESFFFISLSKDGTIVPIVPPTTLVGKFNVKTACYPMSQG
jgi:hypothetical protein